MLLKHLGITTAAIQAMLLIWTAQTVLGEEKCSIAKTNKSCTLTIDRRNPLAPPTIQMYPDQQLTIVVRRPYYFERYFLDYQSGQVALSPDVASSIVNSFLSPLQKASFGGRPLADCSVKHIQEVTPKDPKDDNGLQSFSNNAKVCFNEFANQAGDFYRGLNQYVFPDSHPANEKTTLSNNQSIANDSSNKQISDNLKELAGKIDPQNKIEEQLSISISSIVTLKFNDQGTVRTLTDLQSLADPIEKDLFAYQTRIEQLPSVDDNQGKCSAETTTPLAGNPSSDTQWCIILPTVGDPFPKSKLVTRQVSYTLNSLNLVQNSKDAVADSSKKRALATITIFYGDTHWEGSAGTFFSSLPVRSFSVAPVITNGQVTNKQVAQTILHPTIVPCAAANYRLTRDLAWSRWRSAVYLTGAVGVNPNTVSADFAFGPSLSWRGLMFSGLWHLGHDVRLTQGLYTGQILGPTFSGTATTQTYWRNAFALGVSVRVPSLTGR